jgi:hypothetical protein
MNSTIETEALFALADQPEVRLARARGQVDRLTPLQHVC